MSGQPARGVHRPGARELARRAIKAQVSEMALDLFLANGYEQTTIDDICDAAGISRSTFFRYFPSKEDLFAGTTASAAGELLEALRERPEGEAAWTALRHALGPLVAHYASPPERAARLARLARTTPALAALNRDKLTGMQTLLAPEIARRLGADPNDTADPRANALIAAALGCLEAAVTAWAAGDGAPPLSELLLRAMNSIGG